MLQQLVFHKKQTIKTTRVKNLTLGLSRTLVWTPLAYLNHINRRSNDDRFLVSQWEALIFSYLGVPTPALLGPAQ